MQIHAEYHALCRMNMQSGRRVAADWLQSHCRARSAAALQCLWSVLVIVILDPSFKTLPSVYMKSLQSYLSLGAGSCKATTARLAALMALEWERSRASPGRPCSSPLL